MTIDSLNPYLIHTNHLGFYRYSPEEYQSFSPRITRWHEIDIITYGHGSDVINGTAYDVEAGDVFYRTPGLHNAHFRPYYCFFYVFDPEYSPQRAPEYPQDSLGEQNGTSARPFSNPIPPFDFARSPKLGKLHDIEPVFRIAYHLDKAWHADQPDRLLIKGLFLRLLIELRQQLIRPVDTPSAPTQYPQYARQIEELAHVIRQSPHHRYTLPEMAAYLKLSPNYFFKVFSSIMGVSPTEYVRQVKINQIKSLLLDTELTISEIAQECNMPENYIYTFFKNSMNLTPMEYRRRASSPLYHSEET